MQAKTKLFDAVEMKHDIQQRMDADAGDRSPEEYRKYIEAKAAQFRSDSCSASNSDLRAALDSPAKSQ